MSSAPDSAKQAAPLGRRLLRGVSLGYLGADTTPATSAPPADQASEEGLPAWFTEAAEASPTKFEVTENVQPDAVPFSPRSRAADVYVERTRPAFSVEPSASKPLVERNYAPNVYPSPSVVPPSVSVPASPSRPEGLSVRGPSSNDSSDAVDHVPDADATDPNRLTSPIGTKLLHRKVHVQVGFDEDDEQGDGMPTDPNQCSSPSSTELMHRRVANQRAHPADASTSLGPQLSSPIGTALMNKKLQRQQRTPEEPDHAFSSSPSPISVTVSEASSCSSLASTISTPLHAREAPFSPQMYVQIESDEAAEAAQECSSPSSTELMRRRVANQRAHPADASTSLGPQLSSPIGTALMNKKLQRQQRTPESTGADEGPPSLLGVPAATAWEVQAATGGDNPLVSCLRCLERNGWKSR